MTAVRILAASTPLVLLVAPTAATRGVALFSLARSKSG
jgi:hypothetical protein